MSEMPGEMEKHNCAPPARKQLEGIYTMTSLSPVLSSFSIT